MDDFVGTGRHLTKTELRFWTSFLDASRIIETELDSQLHDYGMTHREYEILVRVDGSGGEQRMSVLARQIEASPALITQTVNRLVERGWIERNPTPGDRRGVVASLTDDGRAVLAECSGPHAERVRSLLFYGLSSREVAALSKSLGGVADHLRGHRAGTACNDVDCPLN